MMRIIFSIAKALTMRVFVAINPASGGNEPILNTLSDVFSQHDISWEVGLTQAYGDGQWLARQAIEQGYDIVAAYGGDGTVTDVASGLIGSQVPMAILPGGTGNVIAKEFRLPLTLAEAIGVIASGQPRRVDMGRLGEAYFMLRCDIGLTANVTEDASRELKDRSGLFAYLLSLFFTDKSRTVYRLTVDGEQIEAEGVTCMVANIGAAGSLDLELKPAVACDDGLLDIFVVRTISEAVASAVTQIIPLSDDRQVEMQRWTGRKITVDAVETQKVGFDGEMYGETPITAEVVPGAVTVIVTCDDPDS